MEEEEKYTFLRFNFSHAYNGRLMQCDGVFA